VFGKNIKDMRVYALMGWAGGLSEKEKKIGSGVVWHLPYRT